MVRIGVTGAHGFVGKSVVEAAKQAGHTVYSFVRKPEEKDEYFWDATEPAQNFSDLKLDTIVHCAAKADDWGSLADFFRVNVEGTSTALNIDPEARFVHVSTSSVYLNLSTRTHVTEQPMLPDAELQYLSYYAYTKLLAENIVLNDRRAAGRFILRPHIIYGKDDSTLLPRLLKQVKTNRKNQKYIILPGGGNSVHSVTNVSRFTDFVLKASTCDPVQIPENPIFNISDDSPVLLSGKIKQVLEDTLKSTVEIRAIPASAAKAAASVSMFKAFLSNSRPEFTRYAISQLTEDTLLDVSKMETFLHAT